MEVTENMITETETKIEAWEKKANKLHYCRCENPVESGFKVSIGTPGNVVDFAECGCGLPIRGTQTTHEEG